MKNYKLLKVLAAVIILTMLPLYEAFAEGEIINPDTLASSKKDDSKDGWHFNFKPSASASFNDNRKVIGQTDGYSFTFGLTLDLNITLFKGKHEWRNNIVLTEMVTRTPVIDEFLFSADSLVIESMYLYYFYEWFGIYGRFALNTSIFPGYDVQASPVTYAITRDDGTIDFVLDDKIKLTSPFAPLTLKESFGPFFRPVKKEEVNLEFLLGLGSWQTFADGNLAVNDDGDTNPIEVASLNNTYQVGAESISKLWGEVWEKKVGYVLKSELMMPFYTSPDIGLSGIDLLNIELMARLDLRFVEWMSVAYEFKAIREPSVLQEWQIQNNLMLTFSYSLYQHVAY